MPQGIYHPNLGKANMKKKTKKKLQSDKAFIINTTNNLFFMRHNKAKKQRNQLFNLIYICTFNPRLTIMLFGKDNPNPAPPKKTKQTVMSKCHRHMEIHWIKGLISLFPRLSDLQQWSSSVLRISAARGVLTATLPQTAPGPFPASLPMACTTSMTSSVKNATPTSSPPLMERWDGKEVLSSVVHQPNVKGHKYIIRGWIVS